MKFLPRPNSAQTYATDWSNFQPRFGFAYQFAPNMVVRGGYGIYYGQSRSGVTGVVPYGGQGFNQYTNVITDLSEPWGDAVSALEQSVSQRIDSAHRNSL